MCDVLADIEQVHEMVGAGGELNPERVAVVQVKIQESPNDQNVNGKPNRAAPIRISTEHGAIRFTGQIAHSILVSMHLENVRMFSVIARDGPNPIGAEEFVFVKQFFENALQS